MNWRDSSRFSSFLQAMNILENISDQFRRKWLVILYLIGFFILGYLLFDIILISNLPFPVELVTGAVFLGAGYRPTYNHPLYQMPCLAHFSPWERVDAGSRIPLRTAAGRPLYGAPPAAPKCGGRAVTC